MRYDYSLLGSVGRGISMICGARLASYDFTTAAAGGGTVPAPLAYSRASGASVQTSATTVTTGLAVDAAPYTNRGTSTGLTVECARTNLIFPMRSHTGGYWGAGSVVTTTEAAAAGPDGAVSAVQSAVLAGGYSRWVVYAHAATGLSYSHSLWHRTVSGAGTYRVTVVDNVSVSGASSTTWALVAHSRIAGENGVRLFPVDCRDAVARDMYTDLHQVELGQFPTSAIITAGAAATRAGARLRHTDAAKIIASGRLEFEIDVEPLGASTEYGTDGTHFYIWYVDASNYARIIAATRVLEVLIGGVLWTAATALPVWSRFARLQISIAAGGGTLKSRAAYSLNGAAWVAMGESGAAQAAISASSIDLLCNGTTLQFSADIRALTFYRPQQSPGWKYGA